MEAEIVYKMPFWGRYLLILLALVISSCFLYLGLSFDTLMPGEPKIIKVFFYLVVFIGIGSTYRLFTWKTITYFKASKLGMYFPCPLLKTCNRKFLFVPWDNIENIKIGTFISGGSGTTKGVSIDLRISLIDRNQFFPYLFLENEKEWQTVGFTDVFLRKKKAIEQLNKIKNKE